MKSPTVAVAGLGIHGSSASYELARRGCAVHGFDLFAPLHKNGSSHGRSRLIRLAYSEGGEYVELLKRAYTQWHALEEASGTALLQQTGLLIASAPGGQMAKGAFASAEQFDLPHRRMTAEQAHKSFPAFHPDQDMEIFFEDAAAILNGDLCVRTYQQQAQRLGAQLHFDEEVIAYENDGSGLLIRTSRDKYHVDRLVITTGPWIHELLGQLRLPLMAVRQAVTHFQPLKPALLDPEHLPPYLVEVPTALYYGFPHLEGQGMKIGRHDGGDVCNIRTIDRQVTDAEVAEREAILDRFLPGSRGALVDAYTCLYTNALDGNFIVDVHPENAKIVIASWCSGHGFKFGSVSGQVHADLAMHGKSKLPVAFLSLDRLRNKAV